MLCQFFTFWYIVSVEISIALKHSSKLQSFSHKWCNFYIHQIKGRFVKQQLKMQGIVQNTLYYILLLYATKLYRTTL